MYSIAATAILAILLAIFVYLYSLYYIYDKTLRAYLPARIAVDAWQEIESQLPKATICMVEERAATAVASSDPTMYISAPIEFNKTLEELSRYPPLGKLRGGARLDGEVFRYEVKFLNWTLTGEVYWVKPLTLLEASSSISTASIRGNWDDVDELLAAYVPNGFTLYGYLEGVLRREGGAFVGTLGGELTLVEDARLRCLGYYLNKTFEPRIRATLFMNDNSSEVYVFIPVRVDK